jgi:preprotein translocase subunit SecG
MSAVVEWVRLNWILVAFFLVLTLAFVFLRTSPTEGIDSLATLEGSLSGGQPVVLEFYSNF